MSQLLRLRSWWTQFAVVPPQQPYALVRGLSTEDYQAFTYQLEPASVQVRAGVDLTAASDAGADIALLLDASPDVARCVAVVAHVCGEDFVDLMPNGPDVEWMQQAILVRDYLTIVRRNGLEDLVTGSLKDAVLALQQSKDSNIAVVLGGLTELTAALLVEGPWQCAHEGGSLAHRHAMAHLGLTPLVTTGTDDAKAAALGFSVLLSALQI